MGQFEPYIHENLENFVKQWDELVKKTCEPDGSAHLDCLDWFK